MAKKNDILDGLTPEQQQAEIDHAQKVLASSSNYVIELFEERLEQAFALAQTLADRLKPRDPKNIGDDHPITEWRLAEVLENHLSCTASLSIARQFLLGEGD